MQHVEEQREKKEKGWRETFLEGAGPLFHMNFWRVVLDEGHAIKNRNSRTSQACSYLSARNRWLLTGTPLQNTTDEFFAALRFLVTKWDDEFMSLANFKKSMGVCNNKEQEEKNMENQRAINGKIRIHRRAVDNFMGVAILDIPAPYPLEEIEVDLLPHEAGLNTELRSSIDKRDQEALDTPNAADPLAIFGKKVRVSSHWAMIRPDLLDENKEWKAENDRSDPPSAINYFCRFCCKVLIDPVITSVSLIMPITRA